MRRIFLLFIMVIMVGAMVFSQAEGNKRYISAQDVVIKDSTGFFAKEIGNLSLGNEVTLIGGEGKWAQIRYGNLSGWISSSSLSARRIVAAGSTATATEIALAGKGFSPDMEVEYRRSGLDYSLVDSMEKMVIPSGELLSFITDGKLEKAKIRFAKAHSACVILASAGYPGSYKTGFVIKEQPRICCDNVDVYHSGTILNKSDGAPITAGGRVLGITAIAPALDLAIETAYNAVSSINFEGMFYRKDIGKY